MEPTTWEDVERLWDVMDVPWHALAQWEANENQPRFDVLMAAILGSGVE